MADGSARRTRAEAEGDLTQRGAPFELVDEAVNGLVVKVFKNAPQTLIEVFDKTPAFGDSTLFVFDDETLPFDSHWRAVRSFAQALAGRYDVRKGDRVAISMRNYPEWSVAFWGTQLLGAVTVPLNAWWTRHEMAFALGDCEAKVLVADEERLQRLSPSIDQLGLSGLVSVRSASSGDADPYAEIVSRPLTKFDAVDVVKADDLATILYTSGTTGAPKGAMGSHRNHVTNLMTTALRSQVANAMRDALPSGASRKPVMLQTFPFFHIAGLATLYQAAYNGTSLILMNKWEPADALDLVERHSISNVSGVPTVIAQLLEAPNTGRNRLRSVQVVTMGGASVPPSLLFRLRHELDPAPLPIVSYGLTETTSTIVTNIGSDCEARPQSVGRVVASCEVRVVDPAGEPMPLGTVGELCCRGAGVMLGYWKSDEATASALRDGWFHTGDAAVIDADGFITIVDRIKDIVIRGGENVYCADVEAVLCGHADVLEAAVVGVPHPQLGEEVVAVVRTRDHSIADPEEIRQHAAEHLAAFKVPVRIHVWPTDLPRTESGKVLKQVLRTAVAAPHC